MPYGDFLYPGSSTFPSATTYPGQGEAFIVRPELSVLVSFDDVSVTPAWNDVTSRVRSFSTSRGRENELAEISAGTATVAFENQDRFFEPGQSSPLFPSASTYPSSVTYPAGGNARPMNRLWIRELFSGRTNTIFYGYVDSWDAEWPAPGFSDALAIAQVTDEFKVLVLDELPKMVPADKATYREVVESDLPVGYWKMDDDASLQVATAAIGENFIITGSAANGGTAIAGEGGQRMLGLINGAQMRHDEVRAGDSMDLSGSFDWAVEFWIFFTALPASTRTLIRPPFAGAGFESWYCELLTTGAIRFTAFDSANRTVTSLPLTPSIPYHVVCTADAFASKLRLYVDNGFQGDTTWFGPLVEGVDTAVTEFTIGPATSSETYYFDELALYRSSLSADRIAAHYNAGKFRGFAQQRTDVRIDSVLEAAGSQAPRSLRAGVRDVSAAFQHGQAPLDEIRTAVAAEASEISLEFPVAGGAMFFAGNINALEPTWGLVFLDALHRNVPPWNQVQAVFSDEPDKPTYLPYLDLTVDYSDSFLYNEVSVTREGGLTATASDATSIDRYFKRSLTLSGLKVVDDTESSGIAAALLSKYKDPMLRVTQILLDTSDPNVVENVFRRDLGDRVRVVRTLPGGGVLDQTLFIQRIEVEGANDGRPWTIRLGVSSL